MSLCYLSQITTKEKDLVIYASRMDRVLNWEVFAAIFNVIELDKVFLNFAGAIHPKFGTPYRAIAIQGGLAALLVMLGTFGQILNYFIFVAVLFVALTVIGVFVIRRKETDAPPYQMPLYPVTPVIFLILALILLFLLFGNSPTQAVLGIGVVSLGIPVYHLAFRKNIEP